MDCIFCKISKKEIPAEIVFETDDIIVFKDANPKADVHLLIVPKKHIESINHLSAEDKAMVSDLIFIAKEMAQKQDVEKSGYKLQFNVGRGGGQIIDHLHLHLIANKQ